MTHDPQRPAADEQGPLRVLIVHAPYRLRGGEDVVVEAEADLLRRHGHRVELHLRPNADLEHESAWRQALETISSTRNRMLLAHRLAEFRPDVVHVHNTFIGLSPSIYDACVSYGAPVVQTLHNFRLVCPQAMLLREGRICHQCVGRSPVAAIRHRCYRDSLAASAVVAGMLQWHRSRGTWAQAIDRYIVLSEFCREIFVRGGLPAERIVVKPNFVEAESMADGEREGLLFVGRVAAEKGVSTLVDAFKQLGASARLRVVGEGPLQPLLEGHAGLMPLGSLGRPQVMKEMERSLALVVPSVWPETFGMVVIEAFARGTPVIASRIGALAELVEDGHTGLLVPPDEPRALADAMRWALDHPQDMARMGHAARKRYEQAYSPEANHDMLITLYREAMAASAGRRDARRDG